MKLVSLRVNPLVIYLCFFVHERIGIGLSGGSGREFSLCLFKRGTILRGQISRGLVGGWVGGFAGAGVVSGRETTDWRHSGVIEEGL